MVTEIPAPITIDKQGPAINIIPKLSNWEFLEWGNTHLSLDWKVFLYINGWDGVSKARRKPLVSPSPLLLHLVGNYKN